MRKTLAFGMGLVTALSLVSCSRGADEVDLAAEQHAASASTSTSQDAQVPVAPSTTSNTVPTATSTTATKGQIPPASGERPDVNEGPLPDGVELQLTVEQTTIRATDHVRGSLRLINRRAEPLEFTFSSGCNTREGLYLRGDKAAHADKGCTSAVRPTVVPAGETRDYPFDVAMMTEPTGKPVAAGTYDLFVWLHTVPLWGTSPIAIHVQ